MAFVTSFCPSFAPLSSNSIQMRRSPSFSPPPSRWSPRASSGIFQSNTNPGKKWAHPIKELKDGCLLLATEKLDHTPLQSRSVVLLLRRGSLESNSLGLFMNLPIDEKLKKNELVWPVIDRTDLDTLGEAAQNIGGMLGLEQFGGFLVWTDVNHPGLTLVIPGLYRSGSTQTAALVREGLLKVEDVRYFAGHAEWKPNVLQNQINSGFWIPAACSVAALNFASSRGLWKEILEVMEGDEYRNLREKPYPKW